MNALLICPADRPAVSHLADHGPLVTVPLLGKCLLEYWLEALVARGFSHVRILAADRPPQVRALVESGARWGLVAEVITVSRELTVAEAQAKYPDEPAGAGAATACFLLDRLPGQDRFPLFDSYAGWVAALQAWMPHAVSATRIGVTTAEPGIWIGLHAHIDPTARLHAPCWIGEKTMVGPDAVIGPHAVLEDGVVVERGATVAASVIAPETFVGEMISVRDSIAQGSLLVNWRSGSTLRVPDAFFLCCLDARRFTSPVSPWLARGLALAAMAITAPLALVVMGFAVLRGDSPLQLRLGVRPQRYARASRTLATFAYYEVPGGRNWLRRWPQFWSILRGDLTWFGNRPLRPTQALGLNNDFERLWLTAPVGLVSLADAHGCPDTVNDEVCAHASFYAVNANRRLNWFIFTRTLFQAAMSWPLRWTRRRERAASLAPLISKQEG